MILLALAAIAAVTAVSVLQGMRHDRIESALRDEVRRLTQALLTREDPAAAAVLRPPRPRPEREPTVLVEGLN